MNERGVRSFYFAATEQYGKKKNNISDGSTAKLDTLNLQSALRLNWIKDRKDSTSERDLILILP